MPDPEKDPRGKFFIDANPESIWKSDPAKNVPQTVIVDLGEILDLTGFTYLPTQQRYIDGTISEYQLFVSMDGNNWRSPVSSGEFSNIRNNPVMQTKAFGAERARFVKFVGEKEINGKNFISIAELGILTE